jgi:hypothetical protein
MLLKLEKTLHLRNKMVIVLFFVEDLIEALGIISARLGLIWFIGFRGEDLNVKVYSIQRTNVWMPRSLVI